MQFEKKKLVEKCTKSDGHYYPSPLCKNYTKVCLTKNYKFWRNFEFSKNPTIPTPQMSAPLHAEQEKDAQPAQRGSRRWVWTWNNYPLNADAEVKKWERFTSFGIYQREVGAKTGTPHLQGYFCMKNAKTLSSIRKLTAPCLVSFAVAKGSVAQNVVYCSKLDTRVEGTLPITWGEPPNQGKRTDLSEIKTMIDEGASSKDVADEHFSSWIRYNRGFGAYRLISQPPRSEQTTLTVFHGPPGTGKTTRMTKEAGPDAYWVIKPHNGGAFWLDGYNGQKDVCFDEFYSWIPRDLLCRMVDRSALNMQTKGGSVAFTAKRIWMTSNESPDLWYNKVGLGGMARRLKAPIGKVILMDKPYVHPEKECLPGFDSDLDDDFLEASEGAQNSEIESALASMDD